MDNVHSLFGKEKIMKEIINGTKGVAETTVTETNTASAMGSGSLEVFATPSMTALMEKAACNALEGFLEGNETTVGTMLNITHDSATPVGMKVIAEAVITEVNGRETVFEVTASDEKGIIGKGTHKRFTVLTEKFMDKTRSKLNK